MVGNTLNFAKGALRALVVAALAATGAAHALTVTVETVESAECVGTAVDIGVAASDFNGATLNTFQMDIAFDATVLDFISLTKSASTEFWGLVGANEVTPGTIRIAAARLAGPAVTADAELFTLQFTRLCPVEPCTSALEIVAISGSTAGAATVPGAFTCGAAVEEGEGTVEGEGVAEGEGVVEGEGISEGEGASEGTPEGDPEGSPEGSPEGDPEGSPEGSPEGEPEGVVEGVVEGDDEGEEVDLPPVAVCNNISVNLRADGFAFVSATQVGAGSSDDIGITNISVSPNQFNCSDVGENTVTLTVRDTANQTSTCTAIVTVVDAGVDRVQCTGFTTTLDLDGNASITLEDIDDGSFDICGIESKVLSKTQFTCEDVGQNTVTLTVTDKNGNVGTCDAVVTIADVLFSCFTAETYTLQVQTEGNGTTTIETLPNGEDGLSYTEGTQVTITASGNNGSVLKEWTGDVDGASLVNNSITVTMNKNRIVKAVFEEEGSGVGGLFGCRFVAFEGEDGGTGCQYVGGFSDPAKSLGEMFLGALTVMVLLVMSAYQKRFW
jgi:hypothetical protein